jgi:hypothetical protein
MKSSHFHTLAAISMIGVLTMIAGCSGSSSSTPTDTTTATATQRTGSIAVKLNWSQQPAAKATAKSVASVPATVKTVRITVSATGMTSVVQSFDAAQGSGSISGITAGTGRTVTAEALDSTGSITHKGACNNITVVAGQTADAGTIAMNTTGVSMNMAQTLSDQAQNTTIAFSAMAMMTGNLGSQSFFPPGKIADYSGFQYLRDNDPDNMGHNTSFLTRIAENVLSILNDAQLAQLAALATSQNADFSLYGAKRFPLMDAFRRLMDSDIPSGTTGLSLTAVKAASKALYIIDGQVSYDRAVLYANVLNSLTTAQKASFEAMKGKGWASWPDTSVDPIKSVVEARKAALGSGGTVDMVAIYSYASDLFSWYAGSLEADVYFCPERHGTYFGSFFMKDAPAIGHEGYSINEQLTATAGRALSDSTYGYVDVTQATLMSSLVETQRKNLYSNTATLSSGVKNTIVDIRTAIATKLRTLLTTPDTSKTVLADVLALSGTYGELDGENNFNYATVMASVYKTLTTAQKTKLMALRESIMKGTYTTGGAFDFTYTATPYLYSAVISDATAARYVGSTDSLFQ